MTDQEKIELLRLLIERVVKNGNALTISKTAAKSERRAIIAVLRELLTRPPTEEEITNALPW